MSSFFKFVISFIRYDPFNSSVFISDDPTDVLVVAAISSEYNTFKSLKCCRYYHKLARQELPFAEGNAMLDRLLLALNIALTQGRSMLLNIVHQSHTVSTGHLINDHISDVPHRWRVYHLKDLTIACVS